MGLMQLMPETARQYAVTNPYDPASNIEAGIKHLKSLLDRFPLSLALAAYNAGEAAVERFRGIPPYQETRDYVSRILQLVAPITRNRPVRFPPTRSNPERRPRSRPDASELAIIRMPLMSTLTIRCSPERGAPEPWSSAAASPRRTARSSKACTPPRAKRGCATSSTRRGCTSSRCSRRARSPGCRSACRSGRVSRRASFSSSTRSWRRCSRPACRSCSRSIC